MECFAVARIFLLLALPLAQKRVLLKCIILHFILEKPSPNVFPASFDASLGNQNTVVPVLVFSTVQPMVTGEAVTVWQRHPP